MDLYRKISSMVGRRAYLIEELIVASRAAANQMKDAGMTNGAAPLSGILSQFDALDREQKEFFLSPDGEILQAMIYGEPEKEKDNAIN